MVSTAADGMGLPLPSDMSDFASNRDDQSLLTSAATQTIELAALEKRVRELEERSREWSVAAQVERRRKRMDFAEASRVTGIPRKQLEFWFAENVLQGIGGGKRPLTTLQWIDEACARFTNLPRNLASAA